MPSIDLLPVNMIHELFDLLRLVIMVIDAECVFVNVDDEQRCCHPEQARCVFIADHVVELSTDRMEREHRPTGGGPSASLKISRTLVD